MTHLSSPSSSASTMTPLKFLQEFDVLSKATAESGDSENFEFDVRPKRRFFETPQDKRRYVEEYTRKKKTELCKNFELTGMCKFGDTCSFAHGQDQLQPKVHLHQKYKTKPCKSFHKQGFCAYGNRCQYTHDELRDSRYPEDNKYMRDVYSKAGIPVPLSAEQLDRKIRFDLQRFWNLMPKYQNNSPKFSLILHNRLETLSQLSDELDFLSIENSKVVGLD